MKRISLLFLLLNFAASGQVINFPDLNFKAKLLSASPLNNVASNDPPPHSAPNYTKIDINNNGEIELSEALLITRLDVNNSNIGSLEGIQYFINLIKLECYTNQITYLDLTYFPNLKNISCSGNLIANPMDLSGCPQLVSASIYHNQIPSLDLTGLSNLVYLMCEVNQFTQLDVTDLTSLVYFNCNFNDIESLDVSNCHELVTFECFENNISALILGNNSNLVTFRCYQNHITNLDLTQLTSLTELHCAWNDITNLDLTNTLAVSTFYCSDNPMVSVDVSTLSNLEDLVVGSDSLEAVYMKNGNFEDEFYILPSPNLQFVCVDDEQLTLVNDYVASLGYVNCVVDSTCSLNNADFQLEADFIYPNPANDQVYIRSNHLKIDSIDIYNVLGQKVLSVTGYESNDAIDISHLKAGSYFIRIKSEHGSSTSKLIKN